MRTVPASVETEYREILDKYFGIIREEVAQVVETTTEKKEIKQNKKFRFSYIPSIFLIVFGAISFSVTFMTGACCLLSGLIIYPSISDKLPIPKWLKIILSILLFFLAAYFVPSSDLN